MLKTSGCAFSTSSNRTTENGLRRTASVSCPPSSYPTYPGGEPTSRRHRVLVHVLRHVQLNQRRLITEQELGKRLRCFGLADSRWSQEDKRTGRTLRIFQPGTSTPDGPADSRNGCGLTDDALVQFGLHVDKSSRLFLGEPMNGDTGPLRQHFSDLFFVNDPVD